MRNTCLRLAFCLSFFLFLLNTSVRAQYKPDDLIGTWLVQKKDGQVEIYKKGEIYYGKIIWMKEPKNIDGTFKLDKNNPKKEAQTKQILGMTILHNLKWDEEGKWENGNVYDPSSGKTYSAIVVMKNLNTIEFTGYIGFSFIGKSETWTRVK